MWERILKRKVKRFHKIVDDIMSDGKARTSENIYALLKESMTSGRNSGRNVPMGREVSSYLTKNSKYNKRGKEWEMW